MKQQLTCIFLTLMGTFLLVACSSGGDTDTAGGGRGGTQNGFLNLSITDAPIDGATAVWVQFDGVVLKPASDPDTITLSFNPPKKINLLALQGQNSMQMLFNETLPAGIYDWLRLKVTASDDGILDSYIKLTDSSVHDLNIPSGGESGLKIIGGLEIIANTPTNMIIDIDLRKSIVLTGAGNYELIPVLKLVNDAQTSTIVGAVALSALTSPDCSDADPSTDNAVYLYDGFNVMPDDVGSTGTEPVASSLLTLNNATGIFEYTFGFIPFGKYTAAFTCQADLDDPLSDDNIIFSKPININLVDELLISTTTVPANTFR